MTTGIQALQARAKVNAACAAFQEAITAMNDQMALENPVIDTHASLTDATNPLSRIVVAKSSTSFRSPEGASRPLGLGSSLRSGDRGRIYEGSPEQTCTTGFFTTEQAFKYV